MNLTSERIRILREEKKLSYQQLGDVLGVSKSTVFRWETGETVNLSRSTIQALSIYFRVSPLYIMGLTDDKDEITMDAMEEDIIKRFRNLSNQNKIIVYKHLDLLLKEIEEEEK